MDQSILKSMLHYDAPTGVFRWRYSTSRRIKPWSIAGVPTQRQGYIKITISNKSYLAHRLAWLYVKGEMPEHHVDHINGEKSDNRIENLRLANNITNHWNEPLRSSNKSGHKGVHWNKQAKKWDACCRANGRQISAGRFARLEDAVAAVKGLREQLHGEFANHGIAKGGQHGAE